MSNTSTRPRITGIEQPGGNGLPCIAAFAYRWAARRLAARRWAARRCVAGIVTIAACLVAGACSGDRQPRNAPASGTARTSDHAPGAPDSAGGVTLTDAMGERVHVIPPLRRVVSLAPNITESIFAIGGGDRLVGRSAYCDYPADAARIEPVGDMLSVNFERIVALKPDLVLMTFVGNTETNYKKLKELGLRPYALHDSAISQISDGLDTLGALLGLNDSAARASKALRTTIDSITALAGRAEPVSVFMVIDPQPLMTVSHGFLAEALAIAGGRNIAAGGLIGYPKYSREALLHEDPEVIIVPADVWKPVDDLLELYPEWRTLRAVRNNRVYALPPNLIMRPGPRVGRTLTLFYRALHGAEPKALLQDALRP